MPPEITDLVFTFAAVDKLGARNISHAEVAEILWNRHRIARNPRSAEPERRFLIGTTNEGRHLTIVISPTDDPTTWLVITGWESTVAQRKILEG